MANTNEKHTGSSEVDQSINANDIIDATDDIPEKRVQTVEDKVQDDLDRGEELYTGFGFGNEITDTNTTTTTPTKSNQSVETQSNSTSRESKANKQTEIKTPPKKTDNKQVDDNPRKVYDERNERVVTWDDTDEFKTVRTTITHSGNSTAKPTGREKVDSIEVGADTRVVIEPQDGNVSYHEQEVSTYSPQRNVSYDYRGERETIGQHTDSVIHPHDLGQPGETTPDYELADVYYTQDQPAYGLYEPEQYDRTPDNLDVLPIKKHYKSRQKQKAKNNFPWAKVALGVAATVGAIGLVAKLTEDDSEYFWE